MGKLVAVVEKLNMVRAVRRIEGNSKKKFPSATFIAARRKNADQPKKTKIPCIIRTKYTVYFKMSLCLFCLLGLLYLIVTGIKSRALMERVLYS